MDASTHLVESDARSGHLALNAVNIPGGRIYLTVGLLNGREKVGELASVLSPEFDLGTARHCANLRSKRLVLRASALALPWVVPFGGSAGYGYQRARSQPVRCIRHA